MKGNYPSVLGGLFISEKLKTFDTTITVGRGELGPMRIK